MSLFQAAYYTVRTNNATFINVLLQTDQNRSRENDICLIVVYIIYVFDLFLSITLSGMTHINAPKGHKDRKAFLAVFAAASVWCQTPKSARSQSSPQPERLLLRDAGTQ